jgi:hypothetical protein
MKQSSQYPRQPAFTAEIGETPSLQLRRIAYYVQLPDSGVFDFGDSI